MKGLENIVEEIQRSAKAEADTIVAQATKEGEEIIALSKKQALEEKKNILEETQKHTQRIISQSESGAVQRRRQQILSTKQEILGEVFDKAKKAIIALPREEYFGLLSQLAAQIEGEGDCTLQMNSTDLADTPISFIESFPQGIKVAVDKTPIDITGGFILSFGNIIYNCSVDAVFERNHNQIYDILRANLFQ